MKRFFFLFFLLCAAPASASFENGQKEFAQGNYDKAFETWHQAAEEGDLTAQRNIAHLANY